METNGHVSTNGRSRFINGIEAPSELPDAVFNQLVEAFQQTNNAYTMSRQAFFNRMMDGRRNIDEECGYPVGLPGIELFRDLYDREAIATRVVQCMPRESWQVQPTVYEDESSEIVTEFEEAWDNLGQTLAEGNSWHQDEQGSSVWEYLRRADELSGIGSFGVLLMGIDDGRDLQLPVEGIMTMNDSPIARHEYDKLWELNENSKTMRTEIGDGKTFIERTIPQLNDVERDILTKNQWAGDLKNRPISDEVLTENRERANRVRRLYQPLANEDLKGNYTVNKRLTKNSNPTTNDAWGEASSQGFTLRGKPLSQLTGTDAQYAWQGAMPPAAMSGTDQQYFGVQFGPSETETPKPAKKGLKLLFLRAFDEYLVQIVRYEWNVRNPRFGMPVMYRITLNDPREQHSGVGLPMATVFVHWSRVIHLADNRGSSEIFGVPRMRPVLNRLLDLRKVYASAPEGYWQSCFTGLAFNTHPQLGDDVEVDERQIKDAVFNYINKLQRSLVGIGGQWSTLAPTVVDPKPHIEIQLEAICIQLSIPIRVFKGSERGELASGQDDASWNDRVKARQHFYLTPRVVVPFINRLIQLGILPEPEGFSILWPDLDSNTDKDKAAIAQQKTAALAAYVAGQCSPIVAPHDYLVRFLNFTEEEADEIVKSAEKHGQDQQDQQSEHGFEPEPKPGFQDPKDKPPPMPGMGMPGMKPPGAGGPPGGKAPTGVGVSQAPKGSDDAGTNDDSSGAD